MSNLKILVLNKYYMRLLPVLLVFTCCNSSVRQDEERSMNLIGFYNIIIDQDMCFSHIRYPISEDGKYTTSVKFEEDGFYTVYYNHNNGVRQSEWNLDFNGGHNWTWKDDTLVIRRGEEKKLVFISELDCYATLDLKLLLRKD